MSLKFGAKKQKAMLMYKIIHKTAPVYLQELFSGNKTGYNLRDSCGKLFLPKPRTEYLKRSFTYSGAKLWNSLPNIARNAKTKAHFKKELKNVYHNN